MSTQAADRAYRAFWAELSKHTEPVPFERLQGKYQAAWAAATEAAMAVERNHVRALLGIFDARPDIRKFLGLQEHAVIQAARSGRDG